MSLLYPFSDEPPTKQEEKLDDAIDSGEPIPIVVEGVKHIAGEVATAAITILTPWRWFK